MTTKHFLFAARLCLGPFPALAGQLPGGMQLPPGMTIPANPPGQ
jgi:hypothetical protein